jgi:flagellar biosynthetic protein FlhB
MAEESFQERTEQATPKRREDARRKGQVARSREITAASVMLMGLLLFYLLGGYVYLQTAAMLRSYLGNLSFDLAGDGTRLLMWRSMRAFLSICWPFMAGLSVVALLSGWLQVGSAVSGEGIKPDLDKINPLKGLQRLCSKNSLVELVKSLAKIAIVGYIAWRVVRQELVNLVPLSEQGVWQITSYIGLVCLRMVFWTCLAMAGLAVLDYGFQRWQHEKRLRMTRQELKEEFKQTEGDPLIKSRIRALQREMARRRMMAEVPQADVVVTNPTELAVALKYQPGEMVAPKVVAKGAGFVAQKIREIAAHHGVPIVEDKPLAQALYKTVELGREVPYTLYAAVAEVLAYVYRLKRRRAPAGAGR